LPLAGGVVSRAASPPTFENTVQPFLEKNCYACHNAKGNSGGLNLQDFTSAKSVMENRDEWEKVLRRISSGDMPPRRLPRPDAGELKQVTDWLQNELDRDPGASRGAGWQPAGGLPTRPAPVDNRRAACQAAPRDRIPK